MNTEISFPSKIENITLVEKFIDDISVEYKLGTEIYGNILVAIIEAVNNAILHGNKFDPRKTVKVIFYNDIQMLSFKVFDQGPGFDSTSIPDPTTAENIENPHGRGIFLMRHLADEVNFYDKGREVELKFKRC
ncbi:MAG: serine/threonine protein kinase [Bacteroidetes bacterium RIFOXYA12_FULL_35_11]|nr:MAG: serine/threonine protein kinase [Bacteroidetes bacterium GWF2_35_48]OFY73960.1 MAG: serine/threonine protein kinase [Bacteroidetes bacterium RIFOXYA12_FULL_35_11]OFY95683.1 MAG: serine/threonine protein kinase [Bacteroidetes bacterium RIFOXYB2_FULL_35_7]OFY97278.1 MAG: serine/threonine protein kinase [Bacteroidetes bacterium RIFOXYC12_FULL_35_7]HBX53611.1 ATP-binding protein [Bacteroidales bacterium]